MIHKSIYSFHSLFVQRNKKKVVKDFFSNDWRYIMNVARVSWDLNYYLVKTCSWNCEILKIANKEFLYKKILQHQHLRETKTYISPILFHHLGFIPTKLLQNFLLAKYLISVVATLMSYRKNLNNKFNKLIVSSSSKFFYFLYYIQNIFKNFLSFLR